jgi:hypothetical protein
MLLQVLGHLVAVDLYGIAVMADRTLFTRTGLGGSALRYHRLHCRTEEEKGNEDKQRRK